MGRSHGQTSRGASAEIFAADVLGPGMTGADDATLMAALARADPDRPWAKAKRDVLPMLPRVRPFPFPTEPVRVMLPPGILAGFGIDLGPALVMVDDAQLRRWGVDIATVVAEALENVRRAAARCDPGKVVRQSIDGLPVLALQTGEGIGASMLLAPDTLERFFGSGPHLLLAPMRDLVIALPPNVDHEMAAWLAEEWEAMDPNHLHLGGWMFEHGAVHPVPIEDAFATA